MLPVQKFVCVAEVVIGSRDFLAEMA